MRKRRRNYGRDRMSRMPASLTLVMCLAVVTGFAGVRYVVSPWMNGGDVPTAGGQSTVGDEALPQETTGETQTQEAAPETPQALPEATQPETQTPQALPQTPQEGTVVEDKIDTVATKAFAVQLGSFSTEEAAKQRVSELSAHGIEASVQIRDGVWKVVSSGYSTKEEARAAAAKWRDIVGDAFVVAI